MPCSNIPPSIHEHASRSVLRSAVSSTNAIIDRRSFTQTTYHPCRSLPKFPTQVKGIARVPGPIWRTWGCTIRSANSVIGNIASASVCRADRRHQHYNAKHRDIAFNVYERGTLSRMVCSPCSTGANIIILFPDGPVKESCQ